MRISRKFGFQGAIRTHMTPNFNKCIRATNFPPKLQVIGHICKHHIFNYAFYTISALQFLFEHLTYPTTLDFKVYLISKCPSCLGGFKRWTQVLYIFGNLINSRTKAGDFGSQSFWWSKIAVFLPKMPIFHFSGDKLFVQTVKMGKKIPPRSFLLFISFPKMCNTWVGVYLLKPPLGQGHFDFR